ncbi:hypothetical protein B0J13DRAFT_90031 [Dactylonectria estremocensis]|uniref:Uncharacterized protein n=1 Tax=Dactylonectria estremocensis TaxID=1079267 RepID=A0A9P9EC86_9HYPO|nr:hypothetical protein B0J13DRAFT_90031 [Dactylonectria estremocensis]
MREPGCYSTRAGQKKEEKVPKKETAMHRSTVAQGIFRSASCTTAPTTAVIRSIVVGTSGLPVLMRDRCSTTHSRPRLFFFFLFSASSFVPGLSMHQKPCNAHAGDRFWPSFPVLASYQVSSRYISTRTTLAAWGWPSPHRHAALHCSRPSPPAWPLTHMLLMIGSSTSTTSCVMGMGAPEGLACLCAAALPRSRAAAGVP